MRMLKQEEEAEDAEVTWEDQQKICAFSKLNSRLRTFKGRLVKLEEEKEALDDLAMELELADESIPILYRIGESFVHLKPGKALKRIERDAGTLDTEISKTSTDADSCESDMKQLKVQLYAKFGSAINLDE